MDKIAVYCGTQNHYNFMRVAAKSLLSHTPVDQIYFLIETDTLPFDTPDIIRTINVSTQHWFPSDGVNYHSNWTYMAYVRLALHHILPDCHAALYMDTDTIVLQDISPLFQTNLTGKAFGMIQEDLNGDIQLEICHAFIDTGTLIKKFQSDSLRPQYTIHPYYNSGVMLMNLDFLRSSGIGDRIIHEVNTVRYTYPDQDAINLLCHDCIQPIPYEYNVIKSITPDFPVEKTRIKHFASEKPLWVSSIWQSYKRMTWDDVMLKQHQLKGVE